MREIRQSGSEGGVGFKPPSLPLFYSPRRPTHPFFLFFSGAARHWIECTERGHTPAWSCAPGAMPRR